MDRRYLVIIFIIVFGCINLFFISGFSDVIGSASVNCGDYTFTIPNDFNLMSSEESTVVIHNPVSHLTVAISIIDNNDSNFTRDFDRIANNSNNNVLAEGDINIDNITVSSIYYEGPDSKDEVKNRSVFFFKKFDSTFKIQMTNFNFTDRNETIDVLSSIVDSMRINYRFK